jgi:hypothetical protein
MKSQLVSADALNQRLRLFQIYKRTPYLSLKHNSYFQIYEHIFGRFVGQELTFVEVGILNGGSLFMWRDYFGPQARIIGVDLNPSARRWEKEGFEIFIGDQSDPKFWSEFFRRVGQVDILLDDGGHTNEQQIVTFECAQAHIRDGGVLMVEDVHTSYMREFGNPSGHSFMSFAKRVVDAVNSRNPLGPRMQSEYGKRVFAVEFFESIVAFHIDEPRAFLSRPTTNEGLSVQAEDFRYGDPSLTGSGRLRRVLLSVIPIKRLEWLRGPARYLRDTYMFWKARIRDRRLARYFRQ